MPMCKLGCDDLFENGYILVKDGSIIMNVDQKTTYELRAKMNKLNNKTIDRRYYNKYSEKYFDWHLNYHKK